MSDDGLTPTTLIERVVVAEERTKENTRRLNTINGQIGRGADELALLRQDTNEAFTDLRAEVVSRDEARGEQLADLRVDVVRHTTRVSMIVGAASILGTALVSATVGWFVVHSLGAPSRTPQTPPTAATHTSGHTTPKNGLQAVSAAHSDARR